MALREILAHFDVKLEGADDLEKADRAIDKNVEGLNTLGAATAAAAAEALKGARAVEVQAESVAEADADTRSLSEAFKENAERAKNVAAGSIEVAEAGLEAVDSFTQMREKAALLLKVFIAVAASAVGLGFVKLTATVWGYIEGVTQAVDSTGKLSTALGVSVEGVQRWQHLASTSGASNEDLSASFKSLANQKDLHSKRPK